LTYRGLPLPAFLSRGERGTFLRRKSPGGGRSPYIVFLHDADPSYVAIRGLYSVLGSKYRGERKNKVIGSGSKREREMRAKGLLVIFLLFAVLLFFPSRGWSTSASITLGGSEGAIPLHASGSFTAYEECDDETPPNCVTNDLGSLTVYHENTAIGGSSGNGSATWSTIIDGGALSQGEHTFKAVAVDSHGVSATDTVTIKIDNTPVLIVNSLGQVEGAFDITGSVEFKEHVGGEEGYVQIFIDGSPYGYKWYEGTSVGWS